MFLGKKLWAKVVQNIVSNTYLGTDVNYNWDYSAKITTRIDKAGTALNSMKEVFIGQNFTNKNSLIATLRAFYPFYEVKPRRLPQASCRKLETFHMRRRIQ